MGSESIAFDSEAMIDNYLVKDIENKEHFCYLKLDFNPFLPPKSRRFSLLVGHNV